LKGGINERLEPLISEPKSRIIKTEGNKKDDVPSWAEVGRHGGEKGEKMAEDGSTTRIGRRNECAAAETGSSRRKRYRDAYGAG